MKKFLIIDGNSILNRAFYGNLRPLTTKEGIPTNAIYTMLNMIKKHLDAIKPEYVMVAWDLKAKTFRHKACDFYKANRKGMPEELAIQLPYAKECLSLLGLKLMELEGYEADDLIGTASRFEHDSDVHSYILTGDRDSLQLINESTSVILTKTKEDVIYDTEKFIADFGVTPTQYIDVKAIMGDSSDNIPGVSGIGEKGAFKLISEYGSIDKLYEEYSGSSLSAGMKSKLENGREMAFTSKFLATIVCDAPITNDIEEYRYKGADLKGLRALFTKLEFTSLIKKFGLDTVEIEDEQIDTSVVENAQLDLCACSNLCCDALAVYLYEDKLYTYNSKGESNIFEGDEIVTVLKSNKIICHDAKSLLKDYEFECVFDTMLAGYVISPSDNSYDLDRLAISYVNTVFDDYQGPKIIYSLYEEMSKKLTSDGTLNILNEIEIPLAYVLSSMEKEGFRVDTNGIKEYSEYLTSVADACKERIYMLAGEVFNINSPKQLGVVLFEKLGLPHGKKTKTGYSTNAEILEELADKHEIVGEILDYRKVTKLNSTYCEGLLKVADENGRVHSTFNQTVTVTGRLSSTEPNLQNIPVRTELGRNLRKYFITKNEDYTLIDADYSQIELKVLAHMSKDANMINAFRTGMDIHAMTASQVFKVDLNDVTDELRKRAKAVNFGIVYGIGDFSLGKDLHVSKKEAKEYINSYFATYPDIHAFIKALIEYARENGYAKTMFGRIRYIPELSASNKITQAFGERAAMNSPIQGTAADIIKMAMINVHKALNEAKIDARLILQVHDELIIEAHKDCVEKAKEILKKEMENAVSLLVPLTADVGVGSNWFLAK